MRIAKCCGVGLSVLVLLAGSLRHPQRLSADDPQKEAPKPEAPPAAVKEVLDKYLKAVAAHDLKAMAALADAPWLDRDRKVLRGRSDLAKALEVVATQLPRDQGRRKVEAFPYAKARDGIKDQDERKLFDDVLGKDGWLIAVEGDGYPLSVRTILIRFQGGKAAIVGGPLKDNQITRRNRIPDVVERLLDNAETFELYSLDPDWKPGKGGKLVEGKDGFRGWRVLGKTEVKEKAERRRLTDALRVGAEDNSGMVAGCFIPRHGLRLKGGDKAVDLVICFQCLQVEVCVGGKQEKGFLTTGDPQKQFDAALKLAGVQLPRQAKE